MIDHGPRNKWGPGPSGFGLWAQKYTMFSCVIHHQFNAERSGDGRKVQGTFSAIYSL